MGMLVVSFAATKPHVWQAGTLEASLEQRELAGSDGQSFGVRGAPQMTTDRLAYATWLGYGIHTESMDYLVRYLLPRKTLFTKSVRPNLTIHGPIKFAVEKGALYFLDEDGVEFRTVIMEKRLPEPKPLQSPPAPPK